MSNLFILSELFKKKALSTINNVIFRAAIVFEVLLQNYNFKKKGNKNRINGAQREVCKRTATSKYIPVVIAWFDEMQAMVTVWQGILSEKPALSAAWWQKYNMTTNQHMTFSFCPTCKLKMSLVSLLKGYFVLIWPLRQKDCYDILILLTKHYLSCDVAGFDLLYNCTNNNMIYSICKIMGERAQYLRSQL